MSFAGRIALALVLAAVVQPGPVVASASREAGIAHFDRGSELFAAGEPVAAAVEFRAALELLSPPAHHVALDRALALEALARVELELGDLARAGAHIEELLEIREGRLVANHPQLARASALAGALAQLEGRLQDAVVHFQRAKDAYRSIHGNLHPQVAAALANEAMVYEEIGPPLLAWICHRQAVDILRRTGAGEAEVAAALVNLARVEVDQGELDEARDRYGEAVRLASSAGALAVEVRAWHGMALASVAAGARGRAREELRAAGQAWDRWRAGPGRGLRAARSLRPPWPELAWLELEAGDEAAAWAAFGASFGRGGWEPDAREAGLAWLRVEPGEAGGGAQLLGCWWEQDGERQWWSRPVAVDSMVALGRRWRAELVAGREDRELAPEMAALLLPRAATAWVGGVERLRLVPPAELGGLPLEALPVGGETLGARVATHYAPGPGFEAPPRHDAGERVLVVADPRAAEPAPMRAGVPALVLRSALAGDPRALARLQPLVHAGLEAREIAAQWPGATLLTGTGATAPSLRAMAKRGELAGWSLLHIATHALVDPARPWASALVLGEEPLGPEDLLRVDEIARDWELDGTLVVLSACDTGVGAGSWSGGGLGFPSAFLQAGAHAVVVSLWKVEDARLREFMAAFHGGLREAKPADAALRDARRAVPGVWMVLVGGS